MDFFFSSLPEAATTKPQSKRKSREAAPQGVMTQTDPTAFVFSRLTVVLLLCMLLDKPVLFLLIFKGAAVLNVSIITLLCSALQ